MKKILIKDLLLSLVMLVLGIAGIWYGGQIAYREHDDIDVQIWLIMAVVWFILLVFHMIHALIDPEHLAKKADEDNPFDKFDNPFSRVGYFILRFIGFTIFFFYIGLIVAVEHDYLWVDLLAGFLFAAWLAVFNYINYNKK